MPLAQPRDHDGLIHIRLYAAPQCGPEAGSQPRCRLGSVAVVSDKREPVPFEVYEPGVYLHGTKADLAVGEMLTPGRESNFEAE